MSDGEAEEVYAIVMPVAALPVPPVPSAEANCVRCKTPVWVAMTTPAHAAPMCFNCMVAEGYDPAESPPRISDEQYAELRERGLSDDDIAGVIRLLAAVVTDTRDAQ